MVDGYGLMGESYPHRARPHGRRRVRMPSRAVSCGPTSEDGRAEVKNWGFGVEVEMQCGDNIAKEVTCSFLVLLRCVVSDLFAYA